MLGFRWQARAGTAALDINDNKWQFQNHAQAQHANNVATNAAWNDQDVIDAVSKAKETGDPDDIANAKAVYADTVSDLTAEISDMRGSGMGWGDIAHHFGLHPSVIGLGRSKARGKFHHQVSHHNQQQLEFSLATARGHKGDSGNPHGSGLAPGGKGSARALPRLLP